jgi:hypothetical protein
MYFGAVENFRTRITKKHQFSKALLVACFVELPARASWSFDEQPKE